jgi:membrane protease YdiL (CAAX protease family)
LITVLAGVLLSMTFIIDFPEFVGDPDDVAVRLIDVGFRLTMGALLVLVVVPLVFGYAGRAGWFGRYLAHMRVSMGPSPGKTASTATLCLLALLVILMVSAVAVGDFSPDLGVLIADDQWVILFLALVPAVWEELAFRGVILSNLLPSFSPMRAVLVSSVLFGLFHFSNLVAWDEPVEVVFGVVMATVFGISWGYMAMMANSVLPAMFLHYTFNALLAPPLFFDPGASDPLAGPLFLGITLGFPAATILITRVVFGRRPTGEPGTPETDKLNKPRYSRL